MKFGAAAIAVASIAGCGSGGTKPFSASSTSASSVSSAATSSASQSNGGSSSNSSTSSASSTASTSAPASSAQTTSTPAASTVISNIQSQAGWQTCGGCGNVGGTGQGPDYNLTQGISSPSISGSATDFSVNGGPAYAGAYYFVEQPTLANPVSNLRYEFDLYIPGQYASTPQGIEFEVQQTTNGNTYNFAWQADYDSNTWRVFNYTTKTWEPTGIQFQRFAPDTWHHIAAVFHAAGTQAIHDSLIVDGQTYNTNISHEATQTGTRLEFTNGFQVDLNAASTPYHVFVDNMKMTVAD